MTPGGKKGAAKVYINSYHEERKVIIMTKYRCLSQNGYCQLIQISDFIFKCKKCGRTIFVNYSEQ